MNVHNILYVLICQNILSKNQKKKFIQDLRHLWSTGFELRRSNARSFRLFMFPLSRSWVSSRWEKDEAFHRFNSRIDTVKIKFYI